MKKYPLFLQGKVGINKEIGSVKIENNEMDISFDFNKTGVKTMLSIMNIKPKLRFGTTEINYFTIDVC